MGEVMTPERALRSLEMAILPDPHDEREISGPWLEKKIREVLPILRAALPREGWKLVPVEPDENMVYAEDDSISPSEARKRRAIIRAAIAAAPPTQEEQE